MIQVPTKSLSSDRRPDAHECVMRILGEHYLTRDELHAVLAAYDGKAIDRSIECGLMGGSLRMLLDGRLYRRRNA